MSGSVAILGRQNAISVREKMRDAIREQGFGADILDMETRNMTDFYEKLWPYEAVITCGEKIPTQAVIGLSEGKTRLISRWGVGTDEMDKEEATRRGIAVCNAAGTLSTAVAECALGLMINLLRQFPQADADVRKGDWSRFFQGVTGRQLEGKTVGLIGFGDISRALAKMLLGFDCRVLAYDIRWDDNAAAELRVGRADIPTILRESDVVSLHVPATPETADMVDMAFLRSMKRDAVLINTGRGKLVVEEDLARALETGVIAAAGLDVFRQEPPREDNPLLRLPNVMLLPHAGASTREAILRGGMTAARNTVDFLRGQSVATILNPAYRDHLPAPRA